jgi:hypothetical protein
MTAGVLGPLIFNIFSNDLCDVITHSNCLIIRQGREDDYSTRPSAEVKKGGAKPSATHSWQNA